jgi:hypothetical protein
MTTKFQAQEAERRAFVPATATAASDDVRSTRQSSQRLVDFAGRDGMDRVPCVGEFLRLTSEAADERHASAPISAGTMAGKAGPIVRSLHARLRREFDPAAIAQHVEAELAAFSGARVTQFISILVERRVWERLSSQRSPAPRPSQDPQGAQDERPQGSGRWSGADDLGAAEDAVVTSVPSRHGESGSTATPRWRMG